MEREPSAADLQSVEHTRVLEWLRTSLAKNWLDERVGALDAPSLESAPDRPLAQEGLELAVEGPGDARLLEEEIRAR